MFALQEPLFVHVSLRSPPCVSPGQWVHVGVVIVEDPSVGMGAGGRRVGGRTNGEAQLFVNGACVAKAPVHTSVRAGTVVFGAGAGSGGAGAFSDRQSVSGNEHTP